MEQRCPECEAPVTSGTDTDRISAWISGHSTLTLSLATFLFVMFQVFKASGYEVNTSIELVRAAGLASITLGVLLVQLPELLLLLVLGGSLWILLAAPADFPPMDRTAMRRRQALPTDSRLPPVFVLITVLVVSFYTSPWPLFLLSGGIALLCVVGAYKSKVLRFVGGRRILAWLVAVTPSGGRRSVAVIVALGIFVALITIQRPTIWVPAERVSMPGRPDVAAYVIAEDGGWTTLLDIRQHTVTRARADLISGREICAIDFAEAKLFSRTVRFRAPQLQHATLTGSLPASATPACPPAPS
jgi:hypothetical protein